MSLSPVEREQTGKWLRLHLTDQVGSKTFAKLIQHLGGIDQALGATAGQLASVPGIGRKKAEAIARSRDTINVDEEIDLAEKLGVRIIWREAEEYPPLLKEIHDPPAVIYVKGTLVKEDGLAIAIVGSRHGSIYGQEQAGRFGHLLAAAGFTIVSGLARGIDTAAHRGAISANGRTIAVLGCGLGQVYPPENEPLAKMIQEHGALISELPLRFEPLATMFPARNRIISGLSLGTMVVEAQYNSGALITAHLALEQNREVMAIPGQIDSPGSWGPHKLIKEGAILVEKIEDVLNGLGRLGEMLKGHSLRETTAAEKKAEPGLFDISRIKLSQQEQKVFDHINHEPRHIDQIITQSGLTAGQVSAAVITMQLKGIIKQMPGGYYVKKTTT